MCRYYNDNLIYFRPWSPRFPDTIRLLPFHKDWIKIERQLQRAGLKRGDIAEADWEEFVNSASAPTHDEFAGVNRSGHEEQSA